MDLLKATKIKKPKEKINENKDEKGSKTDPFSSKIMQNQKNEFNLLEEVKQNQNGSNSDPNLDKKIDENKFDLSKHSIYSLLINCKHLNNLNIKPRKKFLKSKCDQKLILFNDFFIDIFCIKNENILVPLMPSILTFISFIEKFFSNKLSKLNIKNYAIYNDEIIKLIPRKTIDASDFILYINYQNCYLCEYYDFEKNCCKL